MSRDILSAIRDGMSGFSKGQRRIGQYILDNYDKAAFMTAARLGKAVNISESTVVRFASELGYDGYPSMQRVLQEMIRSKLTSVQRIEVANDRLGDQDILNTVMHSDMEKLRMSMENVNREEFAGISFPRYSTRTVRAMEFARDQGATVIALTDSELSPLYETANLRLLAKSDMASFVDSLVAPLSVLNALIVAVGRRKSAEVTEVFQRLERIWDEYQVYEKVEYSG